MLGGSAAAASGEGSGSSGVILGNEARGGVDLGFGFDFGFDFDFGYGNMIMTGTGAAAGSCGGCSGCVVETDPSDNGRIGVAVRRDLVAATSFGAIRKKRMPRQRRSAVNLLSFAYSSSSSSSTPSRSAELQVPPPPPPVLPDPPAFPARGVVVSCTR